MHKCRDLPQRNAGYMRADKGNGYRERFGVNAREACGLNAGQGVGVGQAALGKPYPPWPAGSLHQTEDRAGRRRYMLHENEFPPRLEDAEDFSKGLERSRNGTEGEHAHDDVHVRVVNVEHVG